MGSGYRGAPRTILPDFMVSQRFEQTIVPGDRSDAYYAYSRNLITDRRPDKPFLESDQPQRRTARNDVINLRRFATRGSTSVPPRHPEISYGFFGDDPRGVVNQPRMHLLRDAITTRARVITPTLTDDVGHNEPGALSKTVESPITGPQYEQYKQQYRDEIRKHIKVFSRARYNKLNGLNPMFMPLQRVARGLRSFIRTIGGEKQKTADELAACRVRRFDVANPNITPWRNVDTGHSFTPADVSISYGRNDVQQPAPRVSTQDDRFGDQNAAVNAKNLSKRVKQALRIAEYDNEYGSSSILSAHSNNTIFSRNRPKADITHSWQNDVYLTDVRTGAGEPSKWNDGRYNVEGESIDDFSGITHMRARNSQKPNHRYASQRVENADVDFGLYEQNAGIRNSKQIPFYHHDPKRTSIMQDIEETNHYLTSNRTGIREQPQNAQTRRKVEDADILLPNINYIDSIKSNLMPTFRGQTDRGQFDESRFADNIHAGGGAVYMGSKDLRPDQHDFMA
jgi:hypothetical protein